MEKEINNILYVGNIKIDMERLKNKLQTEKSYLNLKDKFKNIQDVIAYFLTRKKTRENNFYLLYLVAYTYQWTLIDLQKSMDEEVFNEYLKTKRNIKNKEYEALEQIIGKIQKPKKEELLVPTYEYNLEKFCRNWHQPCDL